MDRSLIIDAGKQVIFIPLFNKYRTNVGHGIIDYDDYDKVKDITWHKCIDSDGKEYVGGRINKKRVKLHDVINGQPPPGYVNDHRYSNGLDNRKSMLTLRTFGENAQNRIKETGKYTSDYTGVYSKKNGSYSAKIAYQGKSIFIGTYKTEIEAAKAYDIYAIFYYGKDGKTNNTLSENEINNILANGIPIEYQKIKKERELPKNIVMTKFGKYNCKVQKNGEIIHECGIDTLEEAIEIRDNIIRNLEKKHNSMIKLKIPKKSPDGNNIIFLKNKKGKIVAETIVDKNLWLDLIQYSWYLSSHEYVMGYPPERHVSIQIYLYEKYIGEIPKGYTVDHADCNPLNNILSNLRFADGSLQAHNQKNREKSITGYKGVSISGDKFITQFLGIKYRFEYLEDAARKYNELAREKYGDNACQNKISENTKTTVYDFFPKEITEEYIKNIKSLTEFYLLLKAKKWEGAKGYFKLTLKIEDLEQHKKEAIELLNKEKEGISIDSKFHKYKGIQIISDKFISLYKDEKYSFDHIEDAARKYNELVIKYKGTDVSPIELNNDIPDTKTTVLELVPIIKTKEEIERIVHVKDLKQIIRKKKWHNGKPFVLKSMNKVTFENDKRIAIELLEKERVESESE